VQQKPQPGEDEAEVVADGAKDDFGRVTVTTLEIAAAEVLVGLHVTEHGLDSRAAAELALEHSEDAALPARDEE